MGKDVKHNAKTPTYKSLDEEAMTIMRQILSEFQ